MAVNKTDKEGFSRRVAALREQHELAQYRLGKMVGVTGTGVWNWENGNTFPRPATLTKLAQALGTSVEYLRTGDEAAPAEKVEEQRAHRQLAEIIMEARQNVADAAGVPVAKVRIVLDIGD